MKYLSFNQLSAKIGGRSRSSIYRDIEAGVLPKPIYIGGRPYFIDERVDEHIAAQQDAAA